VSLDPYYADESVTLYHGDCLEITAWLEADVLVTDPPYGMAYQSGSRQQRHDRIAGDDSTDLRDAALALWGDDKPALVFGTWRSPRPNKVRAVGVWDKTDGTGPGMGDLNMPFGSSHEEFYLLGPWQRQGQRRGSVIRTSVSMGGPGYVTKVGHPTAKPLAVMEPIVDATPSDCLIADPFSGGGSTLMAARNLGRKAIGVELEERYCEIIAKRLSQGVLL
jgi:DNA modification methylase